MEGASINPLKSDPIMNPIPRQMNPFLNNYKRSSVANTSVLKEAGKNLLFG